VVLDGDWEGQSFPHRFIMLGLAQRRGWSKGVEAWLSEHVGAHEDQWVTNSMGDVFIKDDAAAFAFKMRWC
jgi:hypothetical protein